MALSRVQDIGIRGSGALVGKKEVEVAFDCMYNFVVLREVPI